MGSKTKILKYTFFATALLIWLLSLVGLIIGIWASVDNDFKEEIDKLKIKGLDSTAIKDMATVLIIASLVILAVSFLGCFGAFKEKRLLLIVFGVLMVVCTILVLGCLILVAATSRSWIKGKIHKFIEDFDWSKVDDTKTLRKFESDHDCCFKHDVNCTATTQPTAPPTGPPATTMQPAPTTQPGRNNKCEVELVKFVDERFERYKPKIVGICVCVFLALLLVSVCSFVLATRFKRTAV